MEKIDYGILTAVPQEMQHYWDACDSVREHPIAHFPYRIGNINNKKIVMLPSGIGTTFAASVMTHMISHFNPKAIFYSGTSGGISHNLKQGDVVIAKSTYEVEFLNVLNACRGTPYNKDNYLIHPAKKQEQLTHYHAEPKLLERALNIQAAFCEKEKTNLHVGTVATINHFPLNPTVYQDIKREGATIVDLESSAIYAISWLLNVPSLVVRGVSNIYENCGNHSNIETSKIKLASMNAAKLVIELIKSDGTIN